MALSGVSLIVRISTYTPSLYTNADPFRAPLLGFGIALFSVVTHDP